MPAELVPSPQSIVAVWLSWAPASVNFAETLTSRPTCSGDADVVGSDTSGAAFVSAIGALAVVVVVPSSDVSVAVNVPSSSHVTVVVRACGASTTQEVPASTPPSPVTLQVLASVSSSASSEEPVSVIGAPSAPVYAAPASTSGALLIGAGVVHVTAEVAVASPSSQLPLPLPSWQAVTVSSPSWTPV